MKAWPISGRGLLRSRQAWAGALVVLASVVVYLGCLGHGFPFDDAIQVQRNEQIRRLADSPALFSRPAWPGWLYRPLPLFTYALTHAAVGLDPWAYHATNVVLHALVTLVLFVIVARLAGVRVALVAGLLFAVHPVHVEVVASIANRTELLAVLLGGFSLLLLAFRPEDGAHGRARWRVRLRYAAAGASFFLALLAKESAFVVLLLVPLCIAARPRTGLRGRSDLPRVLRQCVAPLAVLGVATVAYFAVRWRAMGDVLLARDVIPVVDNPLVLLPPLERVLQAWALLGRYAALVYAPMPLGADYSIGDASVVPDPSSPQWIAFFALATGLALLTVIALARGARTVALFGAWFFASFAVTSNLLFPIGTVFADRLAYLPSLGLLGLLAWLLVRVPVPALRAGLCAVLVGVLAVRTVDYAGWWRDNATLFWREVATSPSGKAHRIYGDALNEAGLLDPARRHYAEALRTYPGDMHAQFGIALAAVKQGRRQEAVTWLGRALATDPRHVPSLLLLGRIEFNEGRVDDAARLFVRALNEENDSFDAKLGILAAVLERDNLAQAEALHAELVLRDPEHAELRALAEDLRRRRARTGAALGRTAGCSVSGVPSCDAAWREKS